MTLVGLQALILIAAEAFVTLHIRMNELMIT